MAANSFDVTPSGDLRRLRREPPRDLRVLVGGMSVGRAGDFGASAADVVPAALVRAEAPRAALAGLCRRLLRG